MEMKAFAYAADAHLVDVRAARGNFDGALAAYDTLTPNPGNAMAHQIQGAHLAALAGHDDAALSRIAEIIVTAESERKGYSRDMRLKFVDNDPALAALRERSDWAALRSNPKAWLRK